MEKVIIYVRVNQERGASDLQEKRLNGFCKQQGYEIVDIVTECCPGTKVGKKLNELLERDKYDAIVVRDASRIARDISLFLQVVAKLRTKDIDLILADGTDLSQESIVCKELFRIMASEKVRMQGV